MIVIEKTRVDGWEAAVRGMRNPLNSWDKSDSTFNCQKSPEPLDVEGSVTLGKNDLDLMVRLVKAGTDHSKFMRYITVSTDITAPLYFWKEFDTYKVGTVANSCSTMHKIADKEFALNDFSHEHLFPDAAICLERTISNLNVYRDLYLEKKSKRYWWQMIQLLPSSYNQKRTVLLNYAVLRSMYFARAHHKLDEWTELCNWIMSLPYADKIINI